MLEPPLDLSLRVRVGHAAGRSFRVKYPGELVDVVRVEANFVEGVVTTWSRVAVLSGVERARCFVLEPAPGADVREFTFDGGFVRGRYTIAEKINNPQRARDAFRAFEAT